eukprot:904396-Prorocentrum_minimum.AAC.5
MVRGCDGNNKEAAGGLQGVCRGSAGRAYLHGVVPQEFTQLPVLANTCSPGASGNTAVTKVRVVVLNGLLAGSLVPGNAPMLCVRVCVRKHLRCAWPLGGVSIA